jgi:serine/threonine protein kinase
LHEEPGERLVAISMEYVEGQTLAQRKAEQPDRVFDAQEPLCGWIESLCEILGYLHTEARAVHRDLKPRNLMLTAAGKLKVADFGIAATCLESLARVSQHQGSSGTPAYMSPQQAQGEPPAPSDDIYSLGATLYELLTSKPPFFRGHFAALFYQLVTEKPPSMKERRRELGIVGHPPIPEHWERTVRACLAKQPGDRPQNAAEVWAALRESSVEVGATIGSDAASRSSLGSPARWVAAVWLYGLGIFIALLIYAWAQHAWLFSERTKPHELAGAHTGTSTPAPQTPSPPLA